MDRSRQNAIIEAERKRLAKTAGEITNANQGDETMEPMKPNDDNNPTRIYAAILQQSRMQSFREALLEYATAETAKRIGREIGEAEAELAKLAARIETMNVNVNN